MSNLCSNSADLCQQLIADPDNNTIIPIILTCLAVGIMDKTHRVETDSREHLFDFYTH